MEVQILLVVFLSVAGALPQYPVAAPVPVEAYPDIPPVYNYQYGVNDEGYSGSVFSQTENRDGYNAGGEYRVNLPDGRVQIVTYTAGPEGYNAVVSYEGEALYPDAPVPAPAPARYQPAPIAPAYAPAPVVKAVEPVVVAPVIKAIAPAYAPAPIVKSYAPVVKAYAPVKKVYAPAPIVKSYAPVVKAYAPAPVVKAYAPAYSNSGYHLAPKAPKYSPKKYGFSFVAKEAPEEPREAKTVEIEEVVAEKEAPVEVAEASPVEVVEKAVEGTPYKSEENIDLVKTEDTYRYRFF